jgi:hypothetical protein
MNMRQSVLALALLMFSGTGNAGAQASSDTGAAPKISLAEAAAARWLALVDSSRYAVSWDSAGAFFRSQVTQQEWLAAVRPTRAQVNPLSERRRLHAEYTRELPDTPAGDYVVIQFAATARDKTSVIETVVLVLEANGDWRVIGYFIRPV